MKTRILTYVVAIVTTFSLQSCVSNYVVSKPIEYKSDAKVEKIVPSNTISVAKILKNTSIDTSLASLDKFEKKAEESKVEKYTSKINEILAEAETYLGTPYRLGGMTKNGIDCSGFVLSVFGATTGISLPRVAASQAHEGERIEKEELKKGDLVFFSQGRGRISHVGIVYNIDEEGIVSFIHAATSKGVSIAKLTDKYWAPKYRFAKRIIHEENFDNIQNMAQVIN